MKDLKIYRPPASPHTSMLLHPGNSELRNKALGARQAIIQLKIMKIIIASISRPIVSLNKMGHLMQ